MTKRHKVSGRRSMFVWLAIVVVLLLAIGLAAVVFIIGPQQQLRQQAQATTEAQQTEVERLYAAGIAFQNAGDWEAAEAEFKKVIALDANYRDVQTRLTKVRNKLSEIAATATAMAVAQAKQARMDAQATATARAQATAEAQANATATAETAPTATLQALEAHYQKGLAYVNLERWVEAKAELEQVFDTNPNYKEVQNQLAMVNSEIAKLAPTATPTPTDTPTLANTPTSLNPPTVTPTPTPAWCKDLDIVNVQASGNWKQSYPNLAVDFGTDGCQDLTTSWNAADHNAWIRFVRKSDDVVDTVFVDPSHTSGSQGYYQVYAGPNSESLRLVGAYQGVWKGHELIIIKLIDPIQADDKVVQINAGHGKEWVVIFGITW